ncbi:MAG: hypothetical protein AAGI03_06815 [Pseudomonadota bacterium]
MTITLTCGCTFTDDSWEDFPTGYWEEQVCDPMDGVSPAVAVGLICPACRAKWEKGGAVFYETEDAAWEAVFGRGA